MKRLLGALVLATLTPTLHAQVGEKAPALDVLKWYNTPPVAAQKMLGRAVLVEVFRTW